MDTVVTVFLKYGDLACAKHCPVDYGREELVHFVCSRWTDLTTGKIALAYNLHGPGQLSLHDDEDMATMMALMIDMQLQSINVVVSRIGVQLEEGHRDRISQHQLDLVELGGQDVVEFNMDQPGGEYNMTPD